MTVSLFGDNAITGGADAPALHSAGDLRFDSRCEANQHTSLTVTAGSGQSAVSAKRLDLAAHIVLTGGEGAPAVTPETEIMRPDRCRLYGDETELTGGHTIASCLTATAVSRMTRKQRWYGRIWRSAFPRISTDSSTEAAT